MTEEHWTGMQVVLLWVCFVLLSLAFYGMKTDIKELQAKTVVTVPITVKDNGVLYRVQLAGGPPQEIYNAKSPINFNGGN